jgi:hypothetical protein
VSDGDEAADGFDPFAALEAKLAHRPGVRWRRDGEFLEIEPTDPAGFRVSLLRSGDEWIVGFGDHGFHEHFEGPAEALEFLAFGLSARCRMRTTRRLGLCVRIVVEAADGTGWRHVSTTGSIGLPSRRWRWSETRSNAILDSGAAPVSAEPPSRR